MMHTDIGNSMYCYAVDADALPELYPITPAQAAAVCAKRGNQSTLEFLNLDADTVAGCMHDGKGHLYQKIDDSWYCYNGTVKGL